jgi:hypothetical protein
VDQTELIQDRSQYKQGRRSYENTEESVNNFVKKYPTETEMFMDDNDLN